MQSCSYLFNSLKFVVVIGKKEKLLSWILGVFEVLVAKCHEFTLRILGLGFCC